MKEILINFYDDVTKFLKKADEKNPVFKREYSDQATLSQLESDTYNPSIKFLKRVTKALDTKLVVSLR